MKIFLLKLAPLLLLLTAWQWMGDHQPNFAFFFSTPWRVLRTFSAVVADGSLAKHSSITLGEALLGFILGNISGSILGLGLWYFEGVAVVARPYLVALGALPVFAIAPMTVLWFGVGFAAKVALAFLATVFVASAQSFRGAEQVDPLLLNRFRLFGSTRRALFAKLVAPSAMVWIVESLRITIGAALLGAFVGEFIAADAGLGYMIVRASGLYDTARVIVGVFVIVGFALVLDRGVDKLEQTLMSWRPPT